MIGYASRTGTRRNLAALRAAGWRLLVSATGVHRHEGFPYALDNGAWTAHQQAQPWDEGAFVRLVEAMGADADWCVVPDVVGDAAATMRLIDRWLPWVLQRCPRALLGVQDGMRPQDVAHWLGPRVGVAIGGSTEWKEAQLGGRVWRATWLHVLRVNTVSRIRLCAWAGAHSFDGKSASMYAANLPMLDTARRGMAAQQEMF